MSIEVCRRRGDEAQISFVRVPSPKGKLETRYLVSYEMGGRE